MAKRKFNISEEVFEIPQETQETPKMTSEEAVQTVKQAKEVLDSISPEVAAQLMKKPPKREGAYRFSLYLDADLGEYVNYVKFKHKKSITDYFNELVRKDMGNDAEWMKKNS